ILAEFGQAAGAESSLVAHHQRRRNLGVAELVCLQIDHELADRPLEPRELSLEDDEAGARQLAGACEIHQPERLAELEMLLRREVEARRRAVAADEPVAMLVRAV